jgi:hypothetical protein
MAPRAVITLMALAQALAAVGPLPAPRPAGHAIAPEPLTATARAVDITMPPVSRVHLLGAIAVTAEDPAFGGLSGLALDPGAARFTAVSDRGALFDGRLLYEGDRLSGIADLHRRPLRDPRGMARPPEADDAEELAAAPDGALYVSFERDPRIWRYDDPDGPATELSRAPGFARLPFNGGLEAMAVAPDGALVAIGEESPGRAEPFPMFRLAPGASQWREGVFPRDGLFLATGADFGPDGLLYLLERDYAPLRGVSMRLRRVDLSAAPLAPETLVEIDNGGIDNMEGIAVWRDDAGRIRVLLVSDDNFSALQRTLFVDLVVD